jgi:hypothetical protein
VDRFPIGEKHDPQVTALSFGDPSPPSDAAIGLDDFLDEA